SADKSCHIKAQNPRGLVCAGSDYESVDNALLNQAQPRLQASARSQQEIVQHEFFQPSCRPHRGRRRGSKGAAAMKKRYSILAEEIGSGREIELCHVDSNPERVAEADVEQVVSTDNSNSKRKKPTRDHSDLAFHCEAVARIVWGEPTTETASELRWGTHGSRVVHRTKGVWYDHERVVGGGTLDLVPGATKDDRLQWLRDRGLLSNAPGKAGQRRNGGGKSFNISATYDYTDESGSPLFQVVRLAPKDFRQRRLNGKG